MIWLAGAARALAACFSLGGDAPPAKLQRQLGNSLRAHNHQDQHSSWSSLPADCIVAVMECFASKTEAAVVRGVCRAWRDTYDGTVRCVTVHSNVLLLPAPQSAGFPCLRHLVVSHLAGVSAQAAVKLLALPSAQRLTVLELSHTSLAAPPAGLTALTALRTLVLASSKLKSLSNSQLHLLPQLQHLDLSDNSLVELPTCIGSLGTLRKLNVSDNCLCYLPEGLGGLTSLCALRASNNTLLELPDSLTELQALTLLDLSLNRLKGLPQHFSALTGLRQLGLFASFSHMQRNECGPIVGQLAHLSLSAPDLTLHVEEVLAALVRVRRKQLRRAAATAAAATAEAALAASDGGTYSNGEGSGELLLLPAAAL